MLKGGMSMLSVEDAFKVADVFKHTKPKTLEKIETFASLVKVEKGKHLFFDKQEVSHIYVLVSGRASLYKLNALGEKKVIFVYGPGNLLNEVMFQDLPTSINCEMLEDSIVLALPILEFWAVMEKDSGLTKVVLDSMALKIRRLYRQLKNTTNDLNGEKKLAAKLYKLSKDYGLPIQEGILIDLNLTITYLAEMLGSKRETVSRQAKKLVQLDLLIIRKNQFIIPNQQKLSEFFKAP